MSAATDRDLGVCVQCRQPLQGRVVIEWDSDRGEFRYFHERCPPVRGRRFRERRPRGTAPAAPFDTPVMEPDLMSYVQTDVSDYQGFGL